MADHAPPAFRARCWGAAVLAFLSVLFAPLPSGGADGVPGNRGTVRIGLLMPWTGLLKRIGGDTDGGFRYYLAAHGDRLGGFKVEMRAGDEGDSVASALQSAHQLVEEDKVDVIVGIATTQDAYGVVDYLTARKTPVIVAVAGADGLTQDSRTMLIRDAHTSSQDTMPLGDYACRRLGKRTAAMLSVDDEYGAEAAAASRAPISPPAAASLPNNTSPSAPPISVRFWRASTARPTSSLPRPVMSTRRRCWSRIEPPFRSVNSWAMAL